MTYGYQTVTVKLWLDDPVMLTRWVQPWEVAAVTAQLNRYTPELGPKQGTG